VATLACLLRRWVPVFIDAVCSHRPATSSPRPDAAFAPARRSVLRRDALPRRTVMEQCSRCARRRAWRARSAPPRPAGDRAGVRRRAARPRRRARPARRPAAPAAAPIDHGPARARGAARVRADAAAPLPAAELRPRGQRHSPARDARAVRHHHDVPNEFFALFLSPAARHQHRVCRSTPARREDAGGGPARATRARPRRARTRARRARASSATAGAASRSTPLPLAAARWSGSLCPSPKRASRNTGRRRRTSPTGSRSA